MEWWQKLRKIRGDRKAMHVSHEADMSESQYVRFENGQRTNVTVDTLKKIAKGLGCSVKDFFDDKPVKQKAVREVTHEEARVLAMWFALPKKIQLYVLELYEKSSLTKSDHKAEIQKVENIDRDIRKKGK